MTQNKKRIALFVTLVLVSAILLPIASAIENNPSEVNPAAESSLPVLLSEKHGDHNRTNNITDITGYLNGTYPLSDLPPYYRFDKSLEKNIPYALLTSTGPWTLINASPGWSIRYEHSSVVMPDGSIVLMGGAGAGLFNDVWRSTDNGVTWTRMVLNAGWSARSHSTAVALNDSSIVLMAGRDAGGNYLNDVWRSTDNGATWTRMNASAGWTPRMAPTSVALSDGSIVLMGGTGSTGTKNDTWRSTDNGATWSLRSSSPGWRARYVHNSVALPDDSIVLLGGYNFGYSWWNDTWRSTDKGTTWSLLTMNAGWPGRFSPSTVVMPDGSILLTGGYGGYLMNDTWRSTDNGTTWNLINQSSGWSVRYSHRAVTTHDGNIVLMGGVDYSTPYHDVWRYVPAPVANFTATPTSGGAPLTVQFTDTSTGSPTGWNWSFGDGYFSTGQNPSHIYSNVGTYNVSLNVTNEGGSNMKVKEGYVTALQTEYTVFVEAVSDYHGSQLPLGDAVPMGQTFYQNIVGSDNGITWTGYADGEYYNDNAGSKHWNSSESSTVKADNADFVLFVGHGANNRIVFGTNNSFLDAYRDNMKFGTSKAKWVTLSACNVLDEDTQEYWEPVFDGLHILNSYETEGSIAINGRQGGIYAAYLKGGEFEATNYDIKNIRNAWRATLEDTIGNSSYYGAWMWAEPCGDDYLPGYGPYNCTPVKENGEYNKSYWKFDCDPTTGD